MRIFFTFLIGVFLLFPPSGKAQTPGPTGYPTPNFGDFTRNNWPHPFVYPCYQNTINKDEFHPLRPYPGNPCDPLIPRKEPEASADPEKQFITFNCAKSLNVSGNIRVPDVVDICNMPTLPGNPASVPLDASGRSEDFRCSGSTNEVCFVKRIQWDISVNLTSAELPFSGNTENASLSDASKVNGYLSWYLNGTLFQSLQDPLEAYTSLDQKRITTFSGPLNKLYPKDFRDALKLTMGTAGVNTSYHNNLVACQRVITPDVIFQALVTALATVMDTLADAAHVASIVAREGIENVDAVARAFIRIRRLTTFTPATITPILLNEGLNALANDSTVISELIGFGQERVGQIGAVLDMFRTDLAIACEDGGDRRRLNWFARENPEWIRRYVPYATLEDTTGELNISVIPTLQPLDIDGQILTIGLTIDAPTDSRLYFPHLRSAIALSKMINALHVPIYTGEASAPPPSNTFSCIYNTSLYYCGVNPGNQDCAPGYSPDPNVCLAGSGSPASCTSGNPHTCVPNGSPIPSPAPTIVPAVFPPPLSNTDNSLVNQRVTEHQGLGDGTLIQGEDRNNPSVGIFDANVIGRVYSAGRLIRNTEVREGYIAPAPLYIPTDPVCEEFPSRTNKADKLLGNTVNGTLTYLQLFRYTPDLTIGCPCPSGGGCVPKNSCVEETGNCNGVGRGDCCWGDCPPPDYSCDPIDPRYADDCGTAIDEASCPSRFCEWNEHLGSCPAWPTTTLRSAARVHPFTKTPFVEKLYDLLVSGPQSLLNRWLPKLPLTATSSWEIKVGREETIPAYTSARYTGTTSDLDNTNTTAGNRSSPAIYFPHLGSLRDTILGLPTNDNLNLQRILRPKGFIGSLNESSGSGEINCDVNAPEQTVACVNKDNFIDVARRWTSMPEGTFAELCFNDVVARANAAGVNPGLSLLIWLNESDASNYDWRTPVEDFGVHVGPYREPNNFDGQITGHLSTVNSIRSACASEISTYGGVRVFAAIYLVGNSCVPDSVSDTYADGLMEKWSWIGGGCGFPFP